MMGMACGGTTHDGSWHVVVLHDGSWQVVVLHMMSMACGGTTHDGHGRWWYYT